MNCPSLSPRTWLDCIRSVWLPRLYCPLLVWVSRRPIRKAQPPVPFRPEVTALEDRLAPGNGLSGTDIALMTMGGGGLFMQGLVRDWVGGPNQTGAESIALTGARGDIGPDPIVATNQGITWNFPVGQRETGSATANGNPPVSQNSMPTNHQPNDFAAELDAWLTQAKYPSTQGAGGSGGRKIDEGGGGGGGRGGSSAPTVNAEGSAGAGHGATPSNNSSNYLTNSALASALQGFTPNGGGNGGGNSGGNGGGKVGGTGVSPVQTGGTPVPPTRLPDPVLTANPQTGLSAVEGQALSGVIGSFHDSNPSPGTLSVIVNWGDGTALDTSATIASTGNGNYTVSSSHVYAREGADTLQEYVRDTAGDEATISNIANVADAPLTVTSNVVGTPIIGQPFTSVVASFTDADPNGQAGMYTATVNWGDNTPLDANTQIVPNGAGGFNVIGTHTYYAGGNLPIQVNVQDGDPTGTSSGTIAVAGPAGGAGTLTLNQIENPSETGFISVNGGAKEDVYLTEFAATFNSNTGGQAQFQTFCVDLTHNVVQGQTYAVNPRADLSTAFAGGNEIAFIYQNYGEQNLTGNDTQAAAVQLAIWFEMQVPNAAGIAQNTDGSYSVPGKENVFSVTFNSSAQASAVVPLINAYLSAAQNADPPEDWLDAAPAGSGQDRGQSLLIPQKVAESMNPAGQVRAADPQTGNSLLQNGNVQQSVAINSSQSPNGDSCGCSCCGNGSSAGNQPDVGSSLQYNSNQTSNRPVVQTAVDPAANGDPLPSSITAQLTFNGVTQSAQTFPVPANLAPGATLNLAVQTANPVTQTGRYGWQLALTMNYPNGLGTVARTLTGSTFVVAQDNSAVGAGWSYGMIDQLIPVPADANGPAGVLRVYGTGDYRFYQSTAPGAFQSPPGDNGTLVQNGDGSYTYTTPGGVTFNFNAAGQETSQVSTSGDVRYTFAYDSNGNLSSMTSPDGAVSTFTYNNGLLASIAVAGSAGLMRTYTVTHSGNNLTGVTDPDAGQYSFGYDANSHMTSEDLAGETHSWTYQNGEAATIQEGSAAAASLTPANLQGINGIVAGSQPAVYTDPNGNTTSTTLDSEGRPLQQTDALGGVTTWVRDANGYVTSMTDPNGNTTNYEVDSDGYVLQTTYADGSTEQFQYNDPHHNLTSYTDQNGHTWTSTYDSNGNQLTATDPLGDTTTNTWSNDLMVTMTDANGNTSQYVYDSARRPIKSIDPLGGVSSTTYDANGFVASTTDPNGNTTSYVNDPMGRVLQTTYALGNVSKSTYDANGNVLTDTDPNGNTTTNTYNDRGLLLTTTDALGNATTNSYDAADNLVSVTDANGHTSQYAYDALNRQIESISPLGFTTRTQYDANGNTIATTNANGNTTKYVLDVLDRTIATIDPLGNVSKMGYDAAGNPINQTDANGNTTTFQYDAANRRTVMTDPLGNSDTTAYDPNGNMIASTDANGHTTHYAYDKNNRQISLTTPLGLVSTTTYDPAGNVIATTDANGNTTQYKYDADNREISVTDPLGFISSTQYDPAGNVIATTDANGKTTHYAFDADNRQISMTDPLGFVSKSAYDPVGNVIATIDANGNTTKYGFDADNRQVTVTDPLGNVTTTQYDPNGNVIALTDPNGNTTRYGYDADNRQTSVTNALGNTTVTAFDPVGNVISVTDPLGNKTSYIFDSDNRQIAMIDPLGHMEIMLYDAVGNLLSTTDRDGRITNNSYDADNRLVKTVWLASDAVTVTNTKTFTYDANGNLLTASDNAGTYRMTYDADNRLSTQTDPHGLTLAYAYDGNGNTISVLDSLGGHTTSAYDGDNRLTTRAFQDRRTHLQIDFTYDGNGNLLTIARFDFRGGRHGHAHLVGTTQYSYDADNRQTSIVQKNGRGRTLSTILYTYDAGSRETAQTINGKTTNYQYDAINELTADGSNTYSYDTNYNRTNPGYIIGPNNQLLTDGEWNYNYDAEGNLMQKVNIASGETWTYVYNNVNQLISATDRTANGTLLSQSTYTLDVFGNRISQAVYTQQSGRTEITGFAYDNAQGAAPNIWADLSANGSLETRRIFGDGMDQPLIRILANGAVAWYLTDHLGSIVALMNNQGRLIDQVKYDAFGNVISESNPSGGDRYKYAGMQYDTLLGEYYTPGREDDPTTNRWNQQDSVGVSGTNPNLYPYVSNNPANWSDPTGFQTPLGALAQALQEQGGKQGPPDQWMQPYKPRALPKTDIWTLWSCLQKIEIPHVQGQIKVYQVRQKACADMVEAISAKIISLYKTAIARKVPVDEKAVKALEEQREKYVACVRQQATNVTAAAKRYVYLVDYYLQLGKQVPVVPVMPGPNKNCPKR